LSSGALKPKLTASSSLGATLGLEDLASREVNAAVDRRWNNSCASLQRLAKNHVNEGRQRLPATSMALPRDREPRMH
jgi:hypothetical protein